MKIFIPTNELSEIFVRNGFCLKSLVIEAYKYHLHHRLSENTQKRLSKKDNAGTITTNTGKTKEE